MEKENAERSRRQRNFLLVAPLIVLPFATLLLWSVGVIGSPTDASAAGQGGGLNMNLPEADTKKDKTIDKMGIYMKADRDSAKYQEALKNDPYYRNKYFDTLIKKSASIYTPFGNPGKDDQDNNELKVNRKLRELNEVINSKSFGGHESGKASYEHSGDDATMKNADVDRLEKMLNSITNKDSANDPEMQQLNQVMEKLLDIQHPARVEEKLKLSEKNGMPDVYPARPVSQSVITLLGAREVNDSALQRDTLSPTQGKQNGFYSLEGSEDLVPSVNAIAATIASTQTLMNGSTVKLQLSQDISVKGLTVPKASFVFGKATLNGERLQITINGINYHNSLLPVSLTAYDLDGIAGVYVPGAITRDVLKQSGDQAFQTIGITSLDPSVTAQAAGAGIETVKSLLSKKVKLVKVVIRDGYRVLLKSK